MSARSIHAQNDLVSNAIKVASSRIEATYVIDLAPILAATNSASNRTLPEDW